MKTIALSTLALIAGLGAAQAQAFLLGGDAYTGAPAARTPYAGQVPSPQAKTFGLGLGAVRGGPSASAFVETPDTGIARRAYTK